MNFITHSIDFIEFIAHIVYIGQSFQYRHILHNFVHNIGTTWFADAGLFFLSLSLLLSRSCAFSPSLSVSLSFFLSVSPIFTLSFSLSLALAESLSKTEKETERQRDREEGGGVRMYKHKHMHVYMKSTTESPAIPSRSPGTYLQCMSVHGVGDHLQECAELEVHTSAGSALPDIQDLHESI